MESSIVLAKLLDIEYLLKLESPQFFTMDMLRQRYPHMGESNIKAALKKLGIATGGCGRGKRLAVHVEDLPKLDDHIKSAAG